MSKLIYFLSLLLLTSAISNHRAAAEPNQRVARMIIYVPDGSELPDNYEKLFEELALRTEAFFQKELNRWGWEDRRKEIFARDDDGRITV